MAPDIRLEADVALHLVVVASEEALDVIIGVVSVCPGDDRLVKQHGSPGGVCPV